jgi:MFS family permease
VISLDRYAALLRRPHMKAVILGSLLGRLPIGVTGLAILLLVQGASGSFARGGTASAAYVAGLACVAPVLGRIIDRSGPRGVLLSCAFAFPSTLAALVVAVLGDANLALTLVLGFAAGASFPPITVCMRTFLRRQLGDEPLLAAAFSLEAVLIETIFIVGPMLVALFVALASPAAAVLFAAACAGTGALLFIGSPALARWHIDRSERTSLFGPLGERGFAALLAVVLCYATAFGLVEIGVTAFAAEAGRPALAGVMLGLMSAGSVAGGLAYGSRSWGIPLARQFALTLVLMGAGIALLAAARDEWLFAALSIVAGVVMAPALTMQSMLVAKIASARHTTEAFTWSATGLLSGVGAGIAAGGWLVELAGPGPAFIGAALSAAGASVLALALPARAA